MTRYLIVLVGVVFLLAGCAYQVGNQALLGADTDTLVGLTKDQLVQAYGPPSATTTVVRNGKTVRSYTWVSATAGFSGVSSRALTVEVDEAGQTVSAFSSP